MKLNQAIILIGMLLLGLFLRVWNSNWDAGYHLHPDERAIILFTLPLQFPASLTQFFSPTSSWNPNFFAYGSFPLYLLKIFGSLFSLANPQWQTYDHLPIIGRILSAAFDTGTIFILYILSKKLFSRGIGLLAAFFYAISVLPIQLSHFYAVDTMLTFFTLFLLYQLLRFYEQPTKKKALGIGILCGFALATKTSAVVVLAPITTAIGIDFFLLFLKQPHKPHAWGAHIPIFLKRLFIEGSLILLATIGTFFLLEPYAFIDFGEFWTQTIQQNAMTKSAFTFPYTLQYVGKIPYVYELQNIILWGMGPVLGISAIFGLLFYHIQLFRWQQPNRKKILILLSFFWVYFLVVGSFAIGFMRYMLPLYPFFCLFAALFVSSAFVPLHKNKSLFSVLLLGTFLLSTLVWPFSFMHIYQKPPTRLSATEWMLQTIPPRKTLAIEHWDDALPLFGQERYTMETLELYQPDTKQKWETMNKQLTKSDYIIFASNRLYTPLQKLTDCPTLPYAYCYKQTARYYKDLFTGKRGFTKVAEFSVYPKIPFINISIDDSSADESFTVYDHPKVIIFQKN